MAPTVNCIICSKAVKTGYSIKCQKCSNWLHRDCANLSIDDIKYFEKELKVEKGRRFLCCMCLPQSPKVNSGDNGTPFKKSLKNEDGDKLFEQIKLYFNEILETQIKRIMEENEKLLNIYQQKIAILENEVLKIASVQDRASKLERQLEKLSAKLEKSDVDIVNINNKLYEMKYQEVSRNTINEINDRETRKNNLMVFNLEEGDNTVNCDTVAAKEIIKHVCAGLNANDIKTFRVGRPQPNKTRPLRVVMKSQTEVRNVFFKAKELKKAPKYEHLALGLDKTPAQLAAFKNLKKELETRIQSGEDNLKILEMCRK
nr:unnamed protein product [Callosobruchus analis]